MVDDFFSARRARLETFLAHCLDDPDGDGKLLEAMRYCCLDGGKRVRGLLVYAAGECLGGKADPLDYSAAAVEMIHAYSLVHDDLPAMDNDDLRRGKPSCHRAFDEATAILAGDALQAAAFRVLADSRSGVSESIRLRQIRCLGNAAGAAGMCGGQAMDLAATGGDTDLSGLKRMHERKTGALIRASVALGALAAGGDAADLDALDQYAEKTGLAFQIADDILDVVGETAQLGKHRGSDQPPREINLRIPDGHRRSPGGSRETGRRSTAATSSIRGQGCTSGVHR